MSNYAKYFCFNVTKKGLQMRDYCLNFEACKIAADQISFLQGKLMPNLLSAGSKAREKRPGDEVGRP